jgi:hypothetical protein
MRKIVALATLIALAATLIVPAVALAKGGPPAGKTPPGQARKAAPPNEAAVANETEETVEATDAKAARKAEKAEVKSAAKAGKEADKAVKAEVKAAVKSGPEYVELHSVEESGTPDGDPEAPAKLTGIANALSRIMANIERAEARVAAGEKSQVPPGLLKVLSKFLGWLGIDGELEPGSGEPEMPDNGSDEETSTPLPDNGSEEDTTTITPEIVE